MISHLTDEEVIKIYFANQPTYCFDILYNRYYATIYEQCLAVTNHSGQAQAFAQAIFRKVCHKLVDFQQRSHFVTAQRSGWICAIAQTYCYDQIRKSKRLSTLPINGSQQVPLTDKTETFLYKDPVQRFNRAMTHLSYTDQALIRLRYEQDLSIKEMAGLCGLTINAVRMRLRRARSKMEQYYIQQLAA